MSAHTAPSSRRYTLRSSSTVDSEGVLLRAPEEAAPTVAPCPRAMEEEKEEEQDFHLPAGVHFDLINVALFDHLRSRAPRRNIAVRYFFPAGTRPSDRNFVLRTLFLFSPWRRQREFNAAENVIDELVNGIALSVSSNHSAQAPLVKQFGKIQSLCSALEYIARKRNRWPVAKRNEPKLFIRVDD